MTIFTNKTRDLYRSQTYNSTWNNTLYYRFTGRGVEVSLNIYEMIIPGWKTTTQRIWLGSTSF